MSNLRLYRVLATFFFVFTVCVTNVAAAEFLKYCSDPDAAITNPDNTLSLLTLNISHGRKTAWNQLLVSKKRTYENLDLIASVINNSKADIVALQEADGSSAWSGKFNHLDYIRDETEYRCSIHGVHADTWLFSFGTALLSNAQMLTSRTVSFPPTPPTTSKGFVMASIVWNVHGKEVPVTVVSVHLDFSRKSVREKQADILIETLQKVETPIVILGDFNSHWQQKNSQVQRIAQALQLQSFEPDSELLGSYKKTAGKRLDWILISADLTFSHYEVLPDIVSDHLGVYAELSFVESAVP